MNSNANRKYSVFNLRASNDIALTCQRIIANKVKQSPIRTDCLPEISGQAVPRNDDEKSYPLPSALADGHGTQPQRDITPIQQRVIANKVKQSPIRTDCFPEISGQAVPRNDDEKSYPLPSALADGHGSQHQRVITPTQRVTSNSVKHCASSSPAAGRCETLCNQMV